MLKWQNILLPYSKALQKQLAMIRMKTNLYILKAVIQSVLLCSEQGLLLRRHRDYGEYDVTREKETDEKSRRGNFHIALN